MVKRRSIVGMTLVGLLGLAANEMLSGDARLLAVGLCFLVLCGLLLFWK
jgi:hypothetical protein